MRKLLFWHYHLQLSFIYASVSQISFNLFCSGDKRLLSEFVKKWGWFHWHNERFQKYLGWKLRFQKTETRFCKLKSNNYKNINIFLLLENPSKILLSKEKTWKNIFNTNSELSQYCTEKQMLFRATVDWLFNDIWYYLVIGCLDWKIGIFQQTVVMIYYVLKEKQNDCTVVYKFNLF